MGTRIGKYIEGHMRLLIPPYPDLSGDVKMPILAIGKSEFKVTRIVGDFQSPYHKFLEISILVNKKDLDIISEE